MTRLKTHISNTIKEIPKYEINPEVAETKNLALSRAFARPQEIIAQEENIKNSAAESFAEAKDITSSASGLLAAMAGIEKSKQGALRGLAADESVIKNNNMKDVYAANEMVINEKDKAWNQNVYAPWDIKLRSLQQRKQQRDEMWGNIIGGVIGAAGEIAGAAVGKPPGV